jgi:hydrogenase-4 component B
MNGTVGNWIAWNGIVWNYGALGFAILALMVPLPRLRRAAYLFGAWAAALLTLAGGASALLGNAVSADVQPALLAFLPGFVFSLDPVRGFFLIIAAAVFGFSIAFVASDAKRYPPTRERALLALTALLYAAMVAVLIAGAVLSFIFAWESMSLALWALVTFDSREGENVRAGFLTLALSEAGALAALAGLLVLAGAAGTMSLAGIATAAPTLSPGVVWAGFLLTFFGFGVKTGILPVNVWMHDAYAAAPQSLTPIFSGATLNLGVFALWAIDGPLARHAPGPALVVLVTGAVTALLGIVYALVARRMTHLLTHSSIENLGIVVAALGAGLAFAALGRPVPAGLALVASLYHMLNHSAYKTLLFLGNGAIRSTAGTDDLDALGGLMKRVPLFANLFLVGTLAIAALPPFNGFVSEWLTLESLLRVVEVGSVPMRITFALSGALLALTAGLTLTCFVMLAGASLMGLPRSRAAAEVRRMPRSATVPMGILAAVCLGLGVLATAVIPLLGRLAAPMAGTDPTVALVPAFFSGAPALGAEITADLTQIGAQVGRGLLPLRGLVVLHSGGSATPVVFAMSTGLTFAVLIVLVLLVWGLTRLLRWRRRVSRRSLWDAGLVRLRPEMTYTATAFAAPVRILFDGLLRPVVAEHTEQHGAFVTAVRRRAMVVHLVDRLTLRPLIDLSQWIAGRLSRMHQGRVTLYAAYVLATLVIALLASSALLT